MRGKGLACDLAPIYDIERPIKEGRACKLSLE